MFKLQQSESFSWPVTIKVPSDGGRYVAETFDVQFRRLSHSRLKELSEAVESGELHDPEFVREVVVGWDGITSDSGPVPFSVSAFNQLLEVQGVAKAIVLAYRDALAGMLRKN